MSGRACTTCGNMMPDGAQFCGRCGTRPTDATAPPPKPSAQEHPAAKTVLGIPSPLLGTLAPTTNAPPTMQSATQPMSAVPQAPAFPPFSPTASTSPIASASPIAGPPPPQPQGFSTQRSPQPLPPQAPPPQPAAPPAVAPYAPPAPYAAPTPAFAPQPISPQQAISPQLAISPQPAHGAGQAGTPVAARTMMGFSMPAELRSSLQPAPAPAPPMSPPAAAAPPANQAPRAVSPAGPSGGFGAKTMLGVPSPEMMAELQQVAREHAAMQQAQSASPQAPTAQAAFPQAAPIHSASPFDAAAPQPLPVGQPAQDQAARRPEPSAMKTMLGVAIPGIAPMAAPAPAANAYAPPANAYAPPANAAPPGHAPQTSVAMKTMLGVAIPGIAPMAASAPPANAQASSPMRTMLGVAAPGIAPTNAGHAQSPQYGQPQPANRPPTEPLPAVLPAPRAPAFDEPVPSAPRVGKKKGFPIAAVAGGGLVLALVVGGLIAFFMHGGAPIVATPQLGASGNEQLHLKCSSCADGTTASIGAAKATFQHNEADIDLASPLIVGDNEFSIVIDRPSVGRDETIKVKIPVSYRIRADLSKLGGATPTMGVAVEAAPGAVVTVDGKPVAIDANGKGTVDVDVSSETTGFADETKTIERKWSYVVTPVKGDPAKGDVTAKVSILPLHLDAPLLRHVTAAKTIWVSGKTGKDAKLTLNGDKVDVKADGTFEKETPLTDGDNKFTLVASSASATSPMAPRIGTFLVRRVANGAAIANELATRASSDGVLASYDAFASNVDASVGKMVYFEGSVVEGRVPPHQALLVVDDAKGCAKAPCLLRVVFGSGVDLDVRSGQPVRGYGRLARSVQSKDGKTVPEIEAEILTTGKK